MAACKHFHQISILHHIILSKLVVNDLRTKKMIKTSDFTSLQIVTLLSRIEEREAG